MGMKEGDLAEH